MITRFFEMDVVAIKAQTHATLTGLRAVLRYYAITGDKELLKKVVERYQLYRDLAITENYENYNWFERPEWTEPCAIIDSYLLSVQLWQSHQNQDYVEDASIYIIMQFAIRSVLTEDLGVIIVRVRLIIL